jgi:uncharacterized protein YjdB
MKCIFLLSVLFVTVFQNNSHAKDRIARGNDARLRPNSNSRFHFVENIGQLSDQYRNPRKDIQFSFGASKGLNIFISSSAIHYQFSKADGGILPNRKTEKKSRVSELNSVDTSAINFSMYRMDVELIGANKMAERITEEEQSYFERHFISGRGEQGETAHHYARITYKNVYPSIDWRLSTHDGQLKHEFLVHDGGNVRDIRLKYSGSTKIKLNESGELLVATPLGTIKENAPFCYQSNGRTVNSRYILKGNILTYQTGSYNGDLVIDPAIEWSTYYGGEGTDEVACVASDNSGNQYVAGRTGSVSDIATTGAHSTSYSGTRDCFLLKISSSGIPSWCTYYGGAGDDYATAVAVDDIGNIYLGGDSKSTSGIATSGSHQSTFIGPVYDAFLVKFNSAGSRLWGTYFEGDGYAEISSLATDHSNNIFITGVAGSFTDIATSGAFQTSVSPTNVDLFLSKFNSSGVRQWGTYYGGTGLEVSGGITTDNSGNVFIGGLTRSTSGISSSGSHQESYAGGDEDMFLVKFSNSGSRLWATYYGGSGVESMGGIATDIAGSVYFVGATSSMTQMATPGAHKSVKGANFEGVLCKFNGSGIRQWATYYGGNGWDELSTLKVHNNFIYAGGRTGSFGEIATPGAYHLGFAGGGFDGFLVKFDTSGNRSWGTYFGGDGYDALLSVSRWNEYIFLAGNTYSTSGIHTAGAYQTVNAGESDAFIASFSDDTAEIAGPFSLCVATTANYSNALPGGAWSSSNTAVAIVGSANGILNAIASGTVTLSYTAGAVIKTKSITILGVPSINTVAPSIAIPGTSVTITGTNFNTTPASNIVYFGATRATVNTASATSLNVTVPVGATRDFVTVNNPACTLTGYSQYPFMPKYDNTPYVGGVVNFAPKVDFTTGSLATTVATGDLDGDGKPDMVVANIGADNVTILRNTGSAGTVSFVAAFDLTAGNEPRGVAIGDVDGDGKLDLAIANTGNNTISLFRNTSTVGTISFAARINVAAGSYPYYLAIGDIDRDGRSDLVVANYASNAVGVLRNTGNVGSISFAARVGFATGDSPCSIAIGDLDGDTKPDLAVVNIISSSLSILRNTSSAGSVSFATRVDLVTEDEPNHVVIGDINGDSMPDLSISCYALDYVSVYRNTCSTGVISFASLVNFSVGDSPTGFALGDIDGDGKPDLAVTNYSSNAVSLLRNTGTSGSISFGARTEFATDANPYSLVVADIDGDTKPDITTANFGSNTISVLRNNPVPAISPITGTPTVCTGSNTTLSSATTGGTWSSSNTAVGTVGATTGIVSGLTVGTTRISYTVSGNSVTQVVTVLTTPSAGIITGTATTCPSATTTLSNSVSGGTWSSSNTAVATIGSTGIVTGLTTGTTEISYTVTNSCGTAATSTILTVNLSPDAGAITGTTTLCTGGATTLSNTTPDGVWSSANDAIATIGTSGVVTGVGAGTASISYTVTNSCGSVAATTVVTVSATLTGVTDITGATALCAGTTTTLANATADGAWSSSNTSVATVDGSGVVTGIAGGTTIISYTITNTCGSLSATHTLTVNAAPVITGSIAMCVGQTSSLSASPSGGTWNSSNTAVATVHASSGLLTGVGAGTAEISYTPATGCLAKVIVTVGTAPASIIGTMSACQGATSDLDHADAGGTWSSSNTAKATINSGTGLVTAVSAGTATITYALSAGCFRAATFTVYNNPGAIGGTAALCEGAATTLSCSPGGGTWNSSDPATATIGTTGVVNSISAGTTTISYVSGTGCAATRVVTVNTLPDAITGTTLVCVGSTTTLGSAPGSGTWTSSLTSRATVNAATGVVTGLSAGTTNISYTLAGGCRRTAIVSVAATPSAITGSLALCVGSTSDLNSATTGGTWNAVAASVAIINSSTGLVSGIGAGTSVISYVTSSGCARTAVVTVSISGSTITGDALVCVGQTNATLSSGMTGGTWASSNTTIATVHAASGLLTGIGAGNANITYTRTPGCYNIIEATVNAAVGTITGAASVAAGATTTLTSSTGGGAWSSTNTLKATVDAATGEVTGVTAGTTTISYLVSTGCYRARTMIITATRPGLTPETEAAITVLKVYPNPTAGRITVEAPVSGTFTVYTIEGRLVSQYPVSTAATTVSLPQNIATGVYMCRFNGEDGSTAMVRMVYEP